MAGGVTKRGFIRARVCLSRTRPRISPHRASTWLRITITVIVGVVVVVYVAAARAGGGGGRARRLSVRRRRRRRRRTAPAPCSTEAGAAGLSASGGRAPSCLASPPMPGRGSERALAMKLRRWRCAREQPAAKSCALARSGSAPPT
eukprot:scaffold4314_cov388-Prasinococcus_capsulatus_cf.AAC.5